MHYGVIYMQTVRKPILIPLHREELIDIINDIMELKTNQEWNEIMEGAKFPYGPVNKLAEVFQDAQVIHNGMVHEMVHDKVGPIKVVSMGDQILKPKIAHFLVMILFFQK